MPRPTAPPRPASTMSPSPPSTLTFAPGQIQQTVTVTVDRRARRRGHQDVHRQPLQPHGRHDRPGAGHRHHPQRHSLAGPRDRQCDRDRPVPRRPTTATFTVTLSAASTQPVTVEYVTADGTAMAGSDYVAVPPSMLTFAAGQTQQTITVTVDPEPAGRGRQDLHGQPLRPRPAPRSSPAQATGTINPQVAAGRLDRLGDGARQRQRPDRSDVRRHPVRPVAPDGERGLRHGRRHRHGGRRLRRHRGDAHLRRRARPQQTIMVQVEAAPQYDVSKTFTVNLSGPTGAAHQRPARPPARSSTPISRPRSRSAMRR